MSLSADAVKRLMIATTSKAVGNEIADSHNQAQAMVAQNLFVVPALIVATNVSQTIDFGALAVGDKVIHIPAVAGNSNFLAISVAGTLGVAAVVGDLYLVLRAYSAPAASTATF